MLFVYVRYIVELDLTKLVKRVYPSFHGNKGLDIVHVALGWDTDAYLHSYFFQLVPNNTPGLRETLNHQSV